MLVAEIKTQSPYGYRSEHTWDELAEKAIALGDAISVHTDPRWGGHGVDDIRKVRAMTDKPILAKGIHWNDWQVDAALGNGATWCLVVGRKHKHPQVWVEPTRHQMEHWTLHPQSFFDWPSGVVVINRRDLGTGYHIPQADGWIETVATRTDMEVVVASFVEEGVLIPHAMGRIVGEGLMSWR